MKQFTIAGTSLVATFVLIGGVVSAANVDPAKKTTDNADPLIYQETVQVDLSADSNNIAWFKYYVQSSRNSASYYVTATGSNVSVKVYSANDLSKPLAPRTSNPKGAYDFSKGSWYYISCEKTVESQDASFTLKVSDYYYGATNIAKDQDVYYYLGTTDQAGGKTKVNGLKNINGSIQYFEEGIQQTGWQTIDGNKYYFDKDGNAVTGFKKNLEGDGKAYGFDENGVQYTGLAKIGSGIYYFGGENGSALTGLCKITEGEGEAAVDNYYYFGADDYKATTSNVEYIDKGTPDEKYYFFDQNGVARKGWYHSIFFGADYYLDPVDAHAWNGLQTVGTGEDAGLCYFKDYKAQTGFQTITVGEGDEAVENTYYFGDDFKAYTGLCQVQNNQSTEWCLFDDNGVAQSGWQTVVTDEEEKISWDFYFNPVNYYAYKGFKTIDGKRYYFDDEFAYAREGWQKDSVGRSYYFDPEAEHPCALTGLNTVEEDEICFFDDNGIAIGGWKTISGKQYYFDPEADHHNALTGFQYYIDGETYMFGADGVALTGFQEYWGDTYYFDPIAEHPCALKDGIKSITINNMTQKYNFDEYGVVQTGWEYDDGSWYYFDDEGFYALTGLQDLGDEGLHFFNSEGRECYGWKEVNGNSYFFDEDGKNGAAVTGLVEIYEDEWYLFGEDGIQLHGLQTVTIGEGKDAVEVKMCFDCPYCDDYEDDYAQDDFIEIDGKYYFFDWVEIGDNEYPILIKDQLLKYEGDLYLIGEDGVLLNGWQTYEGNKYYFDLEDYNAAIGLQTIEGKLYLFDDDGVVKSGLTEYGNGTFYFFDEENYNAISGLKVIEGDKYFFNTSNYKMVKEQLVTVDGKTYYFGEDGKAITGWYCEWVEEDAEYDWYYFSETDNAALTGIQNLEDDTYIFGEDGCMLTGLQNYEGKWYYLDYCAWIGYCDFGDDGAYLFGVDGAALTGLQEVSGKMYFFDTETAKQVKDAVAADEDGNVYLIDEDGAPVTDELFTDEDGNTYYFGEDGKAVTGINENADGSLSFYDEETAIRVESDFATDSEGNTYYLDEDGKAITDDTATIGKDTYYFDEDGVMAENELVETDDGTFYFGEDGAMQTGWVKVEGTWYYMDKEDGSMVTGKFTDTDGNVYLLGEDGKLVTGWVKNEDGTWTYYTSSGAMATGWAQAGSKWYFFDEEGVMQTGWQKLGGVWYYLDATNGDMATGWKQVGSSWYYFDASGHMVTGMQTINGRNYFFVESGAMATGWRIIDGSWYYFASNGAMVTGWQLINGTWYYLDTNGVMVTGSKTINGKAYEFASSGACTNPYI